MGSYKLRISKRAQKHLDRIYIDGFMEWGEAQADLYFDSLLEHFESLTENPFLYVRVDEIRKGYRRSVCGKHSVYDRVRNNTVEVMGILKKQSTDNQL